MHYELSSLGTVLILAVLDKMYWTTAKQQQHRAPWTHSELPLTMS